MQGRDLKKENDWFDRPASRRLLWRLLYGACTVSVLLELVLIGKASPDGWWFFYALLGFIACALMILAAKGLGAWLKRPEDYYAETEETTLPEDIDESLR
jgi:hypothetical protein